MQSIQILTDVRKHARTYCTRVPHARASARTGVRARRLPAPDRLRGAVPRELRQRDAARAARGGRRHRPAEHRGGPLPERGGAPPAEGQIIGMTMVSKERSAGVGLPLFATG